MKNTNKDLSGCLKKMKKCSEWLTLPAELAGKPVHTPEFLLALYRCMAECGGAIL